MNNIDDNTRVAVEVVSSGVRLSGELLSGIFRTAIDLLRGQRNTPYKGSHYEDKDKSGKLKIQELVNKHKGGINALDENISKEQVKDYSKELKKLGVDFSVKKNGKDNYSFFFASKDNAIMEKALKNIIERKDHKLSKQQSKESAKEKPNKMENEKKETNKKTVLPFKSKNGPVTADSSSNNEKNPKEKNGINTGTKKSILESIRNNLSKDEFDIFLQKNNADLEKADGQGFTKELRLFEQKIENIDPEVLVKINRLYDQYVYTGSEKLPENTLHFQELQPLLTEIKNDERVTIDSVLDQLSQKEQSLFFQLAKKRQESLTNSFENKNDLQEFNKYNDLKKSFTNSEIEKVEILFDKNVFSGVGSIPKNQLDLKELNNLKIEEKSKGKDSVEKNKYCMDNVKKLDKKIRESSKEQDKDKHKKQDISL